jgi:hypothetical protein
MAMKKILFILTLSFVLFSCEEIPPIISPITNQGDCPPAAEAAVANQQRQVLIEEFTGVRCVNCPAGTEAIENLIGIHGEQLIAISIHSGFFSPPYNESLYDFRTQDGESILSFLGAPFGYPSAVVNRKLFSGEDDLQLPLSQWANTVEQELALPPAVKIAIQKNYNTETRDLEVQVSLFVETDLTEQDVRLNVAITEEGVVDYQLTPDGLKADYTHKHVFRDLLTTVNGNPFVETPEEGAVFCQSLTGSISEDWDESKCEIIAFVTVAGDSKDVLQAHKVKLID